jgi:hypothetical protein
MLLFRCYQVIRRSKNEFWPQAAGNLSFSRWPMWAACPGKDNEPPGNRGTPARHLGEGDYESENVRGVGGIAGCRRAGQ